MESNRDEAKRCLRLALEAYRNENLDTAVLDMSYDKPPVCPGGPIGCTTGEGPCRIN